MCSSDLVIALDISNSMLAEDVTPSRLDKSKKLISRLVDTFNNDKVGLITSCPGKGGEAV